MYKSFERLKNEVEIVVSLLVTDINGRIFQVNHPRWLLGMFPYSFTYL